MITETVRRVINAMVQDVVTEAARRIAAIDPRTGEPSDSDLVFASVVGATTWEAEVMAKAVLLRGSDRAFDLLVPGRHGALVVDRAGTVRTSAGFEDLATGPLMARVGARALDNRPSYS